ncbi:MAG: hypothetical protein O7C75_01310, partial [Verrucomicrobia bacterium]|nr:hypothetical protein [Verrucomicrobiota bacterium]
ALSGDKGKRSEEKHAQAWSPTNALSMAALIKALRDKVTLTRPTFLFFSIQSFLHNQCHGQLPVCGSALPWLRKLVSIPGSYISGFMPRSLVAVEIATEVLHLLNLLFPVVSATGSLTEGKV